MSAALQQALNCLHSSRLLNFGQNKQTAEKQLMGKNAHEHEHE